MLNFIPLFVITSLWTSYTLPIEPRRAVEDEDGFVSTLFQMSSPPARGESRAARLLGHLPPALGFQAVWKDNYCFDITCLGMLIT